MNANLPPYVLLEKKVGQTPLEVVEIWRQEKQIDLSVPLAYAGRLDPMASGKLLVLIGDTCKVQETYHNLDKAYTFEILFGLKSDSGDVLGLVEESPLKKIAPELITNELEKMVGEVSLPYPIFSARTVKGKPLHTWAIEGRLDEIEIPTKTSQVYQLINSQNIFLDRQTLVKQAKEKISLLPKVTDPRKALGNDFRRPLVLESWDQIAAGDSTDIFMISQIECLASSGTYMRSLAEEIARRLGTYGLAFSIHRSTIGRFDASSKTWLEEF